MRTWKRWEDWTVVAMGLVMALTPIWAAHLGSSVPMMITSGSLLVLVGLVNLGGPNLYGIEIGALLASVVAIIIPGLGGFAGANVPAITAWAAGGVSLVVTALAMRPSINASHDHYFEMRRT
ncbi:hypothetical protein [Paeniglutamicibacter cryotolerans]|uniref:Uncharacterized protein (DUF697 family) n=1 Tax=Paeniglutamicibacter cryotolerans TaxID=670079 RepID=A0A839QDZ6_9MICC|nr:hypothetical protein [Paeniglutamicibacter cryotolerans]MBB2994130.1 uncharacterized protein (DUF697 family) [Paeniglutamicibacter cryotolerans]